MIHTPESIAAAPKAQVSVTYPDGAKFEMSMLADGLLPHEIMASVAWPRARGLVLSLDRSNDKRYQLSRNLDTLHQRHREALARDPKRPTSQWAR